MLFRSGIVSLLHMTVVCLDRPGSYTLPYYFRRVGLRTHLPVLATMLCRSTFPQFPVAANIDMNNVSTDFGDVPASVSLLSSPKRHATFRRVPDRYTRDGLSGRCNVVDRNLWTAAQPS